MHGGSEAGHDLGGRLMAGGGEPGLQMRLPEEKSPRINLPRRNLAPRDRSLENYRSIPVLGFGVDRRLVLPYTHAARQASDKIEPIPLLYGPPSPASCSQPGTPAHLQGTLLEAGYRQDLQGVQHQQRHQWTRPYRLRTLHPHPQP